MKRKIDIPKTIISSAWIVILAILIFTGAILYVAENFIQSELGIKSICFGGALIIIFAVEFGNTFSHLVFFVYKKDKKEISRGKQK